MNSQSKKILALGAAVIVGAALLASPAEAGKRDRAPRHDRHDDEYSDAHDRGQRGHAQRGDHRSEVYRQDHRRHPRGHADYARYRHEYRERGPRHDYRDFKAPHEIGHGHHDRYDPYYRGRAYHRGHGHYHAVYSFPVYEGYGYVNRPHYYCGGTLFGGHVFYRGPRVSLSFGF